MIRVHRLEAGEGPRLRAIRLRALARNPEAFYSTLAREEAFPETRWSERLADPASASFVLVQDGREAEDDLGLAACHPSNDAERVGTGAYGLTAMWLDARVRGSGAGDRLVGAAVAHARAMDATALLLWVARANDRAIRFYARHGFRSTGATGSFPPPRDTPELEMALDLREEP